MTKLKTSLVIASILLLPTISAAQSSATVNTTVTTVANSNSNSVSTQIHVESKEEAGELLKTRKQEVEEKRVQVQEMIRARTEALKAEVNQKKETIKNEVQERRVNALAQIRERVQNFTDNIIARFEAAVNRLEKLYDRLDSRIAKIKAGGIDVSEAEELMEIAKIKIETAATSVSAIEIESEVASSETSTTTAMIRSGFDDLREQINAAKADLKGAHAALVDVVVSLKLGQMKLDAQTDTEEENEDQNN